MKNTSCAHVQLGPVPFVTAVLRGACTVHVQMNPVYEGESQSQAPASTDLHSQAPPLSGTEGGGHTLWGLDTETSPAGSGPVESSSAQRGPHAPNFH